MPIDPGAALLGGAAISGLLGAGSSLAGGFLSYNQQKKLQQHNAKLNYDYSIKSAQNMANATRQGLVNAGYNPMLAVQNGTSGANASFSSTGSAPSYDIGGGISSGIANAQSFQRLQNETQTANATQDEAYANADKAKAEKNALLERMPFIGAREKAEIMNIEKDSLLKESQIHNMDETTRFIQKRYELDRMLGLMGLNVKRYGIDQSYNASTYASDKSYNASVLSSTLAHPYSRFLHKVYNSGKDYKGSYSDPWSYK